MTHASSPKQKVLITGANGQLGRALQEVAPVTADVLPTDQHTLDITDRQAVFDFVGSFRPDWVINAAAYVAVDRAEAEAELAFRVNAEGAGYVARAVERARARMLHLSTDFVFDGRKSEPYGPWDAPNPVNVYGESKLAGERQVQDILGDRALIVRTAWLYDVRRTKNFIHTMLSLMQRGEGIRVVDDQIGTPTEATGLARTLWVAISKDMSGMHHWTDAGVASWYDFAVAIQDEARGQALLGRSVSILPISTAEYPTPATRPPYSVLDKRQTWKALDYVSTHWRARLRHALQGNGYAPTGVPSPEKETEKVGWVKAERQVQSDDAALSR